MSYQPNPKQALFLWKMITAETPEEREPPKSKALPKLDTKKERAPLVDHGFITLEKRPKKRGEFVILTDRAWAWAAEATDVRLLRSNSAVGAASLEGLLHRLLPFLKRRGLALAELFSEEPPSDAEDAPEPQQKNGQHEPATVETLPLRIEEACLSLAGGARKKRVRLSALRERLSSIRREQLDHTLLDLQDAGRLVLYRDDDTAGLTQADHDAALMIGDAPRHLVYLEA